MSSQLRQLRKTRTKVFQQHLGSSGVYEDIKKPVSQGVLYAQCPCGSKKSYKFCCYKLKKKEYL